MALLMTVPNVLLIAKYCRIVVQNFPVGHWNDYLGKLGKLLAIKKVLCSFDVNNDKKCNCWLSKQIQFCLHTLELSVT